MSGASARPWTQSRWLFVVFVVAGLVPAAWGVFAIFSDFLHGTMYLGAEPIKALEHFYGEWILRFLIATLFVTPVRRVTGWNWLQKYRRRLGLMAFTYACLHLLTYMFVDVQVNRPGGWANIAEDLTKRWYIIIGMLAFLLLCALALTSTAGWVRRLGKRWVKLHRMVYVASVLGIIHYWMSVKADITEPAMYGMFFAVLLGYRVWHSMRSPSPRPASSRSPQQNSAPLA